MENWVKITVLLCVVGFLKEVRPTEPFIYEYLTGPLWWNLSTEQVQQEVFPISTYSYLSVLVIVFFFTDLFRYKPFIILLGLSGVGAFSLLLWGNNFLHLVVLEIFYGTMFATEVAYYTYIYAKVAKEHYSKVTAYARAAALAGRCLSAFLAQGLTQLKWMNYLELNYISISSLTAATVWSLFLPPVKTSIYFHRIEEEKQLRRWNEKYKDALLLMKAHFFESFSKAYVIKWSLWWSLAMCGYMQIYAYSQPLWSLINESTNAQLHNGTVDAISTLISCLGALSIGFIKVNWKKWGELVISIGSIICGILLIIGSQSTSIILCYICYTLFCGIYHCVITIAASEVSKYILEDSYGLVFALNTFVALGLQTIFVLIVVTGDIGWALEPREQHLAYGFYYIGIACIFVVIFLFQCIFCKKQNRNRQQETI